MVIDVASGGITSNICFASSKVLDKMGSFFQELGDRWFQLGWLIIVTPARLMTGKGA